MSQTLDLLQVAPWNHNQKQTNKQTNKQTKKKSHVFMNGFEVHRQPINHWVVTLVADKLKRQWLCEIYFRGYIAI